MLMELIGNLFFLLFGFGFLFRSSLTATPLVIQTVPSSIAVGSHVWVEDPEVAWIDGVVVEVDGQEIRVECTSGKTVSISRLDIFPHM